MGRRACLLLRGVVHPEEHDTTTRMCNFPFVARPCLVHLACSLPQSVAHCCLARIPYTVLEMKVWSQKRTNGAPLSRTCTNGSSVASDHEVALNGGRQHGSTEFAPCVAHGRMPHASAVCSDLPSTT